MRQCIEVTGALGILTQLPNFLNLKLRKNVQRTVAVVRSLEIIGGCGPLEKDISLLSFLWKAKLMPI